MNIILGTVSSGFDAEDGVTDAGAGDVGLGTEPFSSALPHLEGRWRIDELFPESLPKDLSIWESDAGWVSSKWRWPCWGVALDDINI